MKKNYAIFLLLIAALGFGSLALVSNAKRVDADTLSRTHHTFTNTAINQTVVVKRDSPVSVDISQYRFFAFTFEIAPGSSGSWGVYSLSLIDSDNNNVLSLDIDDSRKSTIQANEYPSGSGLVASDFASCTGGRRVASNRLNLPTSKNGYFAAQKSNAYSTIEWGFKGTIFYHLPDYSDSNISNISGLKIINKDSNSLKTVNIYDTYFCTAVQKNSSFGYGPSGNRLNFDLTTCSAPSGVPTTETITDESVNYGVNSISSATSSTRIDFENQINISLNTYKWLALDMTIASPTSSGWLNIDFDILDNSGAVTNNLLMSYAKAQAAKVNEYPIGLAQSDWASAVGGARINLPNETYTRISCLTNSYGRYVPIKADNSYYYVFQGGSTYTTYIYLPDFAIDNFNFKSLLITDNGASNFTVNQVYLCERVTRVADSTKTNFSYYPTGTKTVLKVVKAYSQIATVTAKTDISVLTKTYYHVAIDDSILHGSLSYLIYEDNSGNLKVDVAPTPDIDYSTVKVTMNGDPIEDVNDGVYTASLTSNSILSAEFGYVHVTGDSHGTVEVHHEGQNVVLHAALDNGYKVASLTINSIAISLADLDEDNNYTTLFDGSMDVVLTSALCSVSENPAEHGQISHTIYTSSDNVVEYTIIPDAGYGVQSIFLNGNNIPLERLEGNSLFINSYNKDITLSVIFSTYSIYIDPTIINGTLQSVVEGTRATITAIANVGYYADEILVNGVSIPLNENQQAVIEFSSIQSIKAILNVTTTFKAFESQVSYLTDRGHVTTTYSSDNSKVIFTIEPNFGYKTDRVILNGEEMFVSGNTLSVDNNKNIHLTVLFGEMITIDDIQNGIIEYSLNEIDQTVTFSVTPAKDYEVESFLINGDPVNLNNGKYTTQLTSPMFVSATFKSTLPPVDPVVPPETPANNNWQFLPFAIVLASVGVVAIAAAVVIIVVRRRKAK